MTTLTNHEMIDLIAKITPICEEAKKHEDLERQAKEFLAFLSGSDKKELK